MFQLPDKVKKDLEEYKRSLRETLEGRISLSRFKGIRVPWGVYSHRGGEVFMNRIRIPAGMLTPLQLKTIAGIANKYGNGILHITTRQDIQLHNIKLENTIDIMEHLEKYNLSTRGGGGNTTRNIIGCALSGLCGDEIFDIREDAIAVSEYLLQQDTSYNLPRKFKVSFSGCGKDCTGCLVNDLGFVSARKGNDFGYKVFTGGGMGADSRLGKLLEDFMPREDLGYCVTAVKNVFYKKGDRHNKHHNRLRFLIDDIGFENFKKSYKEELIKVKEEEYISLRRIDFAAPQTEDSEIPKAKDAQYGEFLKYSCIPQKQKGFMSVQIRIPRGDLSFEKAAILAGLEEDFKDIEFRTSQNQNIFICWVRNKDIYSLFLKLKQAFDEFLYPQTLLDVVACKGALTCNLGLCNSPGLAKEIENVVKNDFVNKKVFKKLEIRLNGCPNACAQHPIGKISFYGLVRKIADHAAPFYRILLGGRKEAELSRLAQEVGIIPAKNVPGFLKEFLKETEKIINEKDDTYDFLTNKGKATAERVLKNYSYIPPYSQDKSFYIDWGRTEEFSLSGIGPGECGAGVIDIIESDLADAKIALESEDIKRALFLSARALLIVKGIDPHTEHEALSDFVEKFINEKIASSKFSNIKDVFDSLADSLSPEEKKEKILYAKEFLNHINEVYAKMDSSFNFPKQEAAKQTQSPDMRLDLKGTPCPINYVKAKLVLENMPQESVLEILLDEGEPINNVPKSLENDGHKIIKIEKLDGFYKVIVQKK